MRKVFYIIFIIVFTVLAALPLIGMPFYKAPDGNAEQRTHAGFPKLIGESGGINTAFTSEFEAWFQDSFAFRSELVNVGASALLNIFNSSAEDDVICGKDNWLYYSETLQDYCGFETLGEAQLKRLVTLLSLEQQYCRSQGAVYVFTVAPNKNTVYPEYMPKNYIKTEAPTNIDRLGRLLDEQGVVYADLKKALTDEKEMDRPLYYYADSHWNLLGAAVAYNAIFETVNSAASSRFDFDRYEDVLYEAAEREDDLMKMVLPLESIVTEQYAKSNISNNYKYEGRFRSIDDVKISTKRDGAVLGEGGLLMHRDSFGRALIPLFSNQFESATYLRGVPFDIYGNIDGKSVVVREIVERNIGTLLERAPIVPAHKLTAISDNSVHTEASVFLSEQAASGKLTHFYGYADLDGGESVNYRVFARIGEEYYEGFPVYEYALEEKYGVEKDRVGFSFYFESETYSAFGGTAPEIYIFSE